VILVDQGGTAQAFVVATDALSEEAPELTRIGLDPVADPALVPLTDGGTSPVANVRSGPVVVPAALSATRRA